MQSAWVSYTVVKHSFFLYCYTSYLLPLGLRDSTFVDESFAKGNHRVVGLYLETSFIYVVCALHSFHSFIKVAFED